MKWYPQSASGLALAVCALWAGSAAAPAAAQNDPRSREVPLSCADGWNAFLVYQGDVGIWNVQCLPVLKRFGCPEIVGLDDRGRCTILVSYSGKWTPNFTVEDGSWLGPVALVDLDPDLEGAELYAGGKRGNLYRIHPRPRGGFDVTRVAELPGEEIHTLVAGDLHGQRKGSEMLLFTAPGRVARTTFSQPELPMKSRILRSDPKRLASRSG